MRVPKTIGEWPSALRGCRRVTSAAFAVLACLALAQGFTTAAAVASPSSGHPPVSGRLTPSPARALDHWTGAQIERTRALPTARGEAGAPRSELATAGGAHASTATTPTFVVASWG